MKIFLFVPIFMVIILSKRNIHVRVINKIDIFLSSPKLDYKKLKTVMTSGKINGIFDTFEIEYIFDYLANQYSEYIQKRVIGHSVQKNKIRAYYLSLNNNSEYKKSKILFTGAHHAREILSSAMTVRIYLESLHSLIHKNNNQNIWKQTDLIIVPIVNIDSHKLISESYNTKNWETYKWKRKNMNQNYCGKSVVSSGVDLNRNYSFHYGTSKEDLDECSNTFRGKYAFSEPETQAIKFLVDSEPNIVSAMNFHTYGNMWIHPFNYLKKKNYYPTFLEQKFIDFYKKFKKDVKKLTKTKYGNAIELVNYSTDGEASDWMLGEKNIISFSPELGSFKANAQGFYIRKDQIFDVIEDNYKVIRLFIEQNVFMLNGLTYGVNNKQQFYFEFRNEGLSKIINPIFLITSSNKEFLNEIKNVYQIRQLDGKALSVQNFEKINENEIQFLLKSIERLESLMIVFEFKNKYFLDYNLEFAVDISLRNSDHLQGFKINYYPKVINYYQLFQLCFQLICISMFIVLWYFAYKNLKKSGKQNQLKLQIQQIKKLKLIIRSQQLNKSEVCTNQTVDKTENNPEIIPTLSQFTFIIVNFKSNQTRESKTNQST